MAEKRHLDHAVDDFTILTCPWCGSTDVAWGPEWSAKAEDGDYEESLTEYICRACYHSFWI